MRKAVTEKTYTTPEMRLRVTVWAYDLEGKRKYDILLEQGGASWRFKSEHVKVGADNVTPRHVGMMIQTAARMFPSPMVELMADAIREAGVNLKAEAGKCEFCPVTGSCSVCGWDDYNPDDWESQPKRGKV